MKIHTQLLICAVSAALITVKASTGSARELAGDSLGSPRRTDG